MNRLFWNVFQFKIQIQRKLDFLHHRNPPRRFCGGGSPTFLRMIGARMAIQKMADSAIEETKNLVSKTVFLFFHMHLQQIDWQFHNGAISIVVQCRKNALTQLFMAYKSFNSIRNFNRNSFFSTIFDYIQ